MELDRQIEDILHRLSKSGDEQDFKALYNLLYDRFFRIAFYFVKQDYLAQEIVLDVFMILWKKRADLPKLKSFDNYSFILLKNTSLAYLSKRKTETITIEEAVLTEDSESTPIDKLLNEELLLVYIRALEELPPRCREVFILIREKGYSYKEAADKLQISPKTVDAQLQKALSKLKTQLKEYFS